MEPKQAAGINIREERFQGPQLEASPLFEVYIDGVACRPLFLSADWAVIFFGMND